MVKKHQLFHVLGSIFYDSRKILDAKFKAFGLSRSQWLVLAMLRFHPDTLTQRYALKYLGVEKSYFTKVLNSLEEKGYIVREIDINNRRNRLIKINKHNKKELEKIFNILKQYDEHIQINLTTSDLKTLHQLLSKITSSIHDYPQEKHL